MLLDAGFAPRTLARRARRAGIDLTRLSGVVLTHEHLDHARGGIRIAAASGCSLYASPGTLERLGTRLEGVSVEVIAQLESRVLGPFTVTACHTIHDAVEPLALAVTGPAGEKTALAYDLGRATSVVRYLLRGADCLIVEANHDEVMLRMGPYPPSVRQRIGGPNGHLSNRAAAELLEDVWHPRLGAVVLAHISETCNRWELAWEAARDALAGRAYGGRLLIATQDLALAPFDVGDP